MATHAGNGPARRAYLRRFCGEPVKNPMRSLIMLPITIVERHPEVACLFARVPLRNLYEGDARPRSVSVPWLTEPLVAGSR